MHSFHFIDMDVCSILFIVCGSSFICVSRAHRRHHRHHPYSHPHLHITEKCMHCIHISTCTVHTPYCEYSNELIFFFYLIIVALTVCVWGFNMIFSLRLLHYSASETMYAIKIFSIQYWFKISLHTLKFILKLVFFLPQREWKGERKPQSHDTNTRKKDCRAENPRIMLCGKFSPQNHISSTISNNKHAMVNRSSSTYSAHRTTRCKRYDNNINIGSWDGRSRSHRSSPAKNVSEQTKASNLNFRLSWHNSV